MAPHVAEVVMRSHNVFLSSVYINLQETHKITIEDKFLTTDLVEQLMEFLKIY